MINAIGERLDNDFIESHRKLKEKVVKGKDGHLLGANPSAWPGLAVHFNQMPGGFHWDGKSLHSGWDVINPWGPFSQCILVFPHLGIYLVIHPGDIIFLRGAALKHGVQRWMGRGRMVIVPFVDRRLFGAEQVRRPCTFRPLYGDQHKKLRQLFPAHELADILKMAT